MPSSVVLMAFDGILSMSILIGWQESQVVRGTYFSFMFACLRTEYPDAAGS